MKKTSNPEENAILISKKAYNGFVTRIRETLGAVYQNPESIDTAISLFDNYVKGEISDLDSTDTLVKVALMVLKSEIDKAMRRSSAARERARLRREKSMSETAHSIQASEGAKIQASLKSDVDYPMNRRERREYERELAREQRRFERRKRRLLNAEHCAGGQFQE